MREVTPPPLQPPSSKERKYDRQLRLWAASGQAALEECHILLINSGPGVVGVESLKNLVLPGIGQFTVLDPSSVTHADLGVNFFLRDSDLGKSRAKCCSNLLQELNPDVKSHYVSQSLESFFSTPNGLEPYTIILAVLPLSFSILDQISKHSCESRVPIFYIHSLGFYSHFTVQLPASFPIVDTHPDPASTVDLRLLQPWPELLEFAQLKTANMANMDDEEHGHIPYALLILQGLQDWKATHDGSVPSSYKEKTEFRDQLRQLTRTNNSEGGEENFDEAIAAVLKSLNFPTPSSAVKEVFSAEECQNLTQGTPAFWIIARAVNIFFTDHGVLPLAGGIPDMKAKSDDYVKLQNIYKTKARQDVAEVYRHVQSLESQLGTQQPIELKEVEAYCKSAGYVKLIRGGVPHFAKTKSKFTWGDRVRSAANSLQNPDSLLLLYIAFLAYDRAILEQDPKVSSTEELSSTNMLQYARGILQDLVSEASINLEEEEQSELYEQLTQIVDEFIRAKGGELHNISALTGGMVAQEAIKVITKQYIPVDNTCIFDGVLSKSSVMKL